MSFNLTLAVLAAIAGLAASSEVYAPIASPTPPSGIYSPTHPSDRSARRVSATKRRAVVDKPDEDTVQSVDNPTSSPVPKARFSSPTPPADYLLVEDSVESKPEEDAQPIGVGDDTRNDLETNVMDTCDEDCLQGTEEAETQGFVNTTKEELEGIVATKIDVAETTVETAEPTDAELSSPQPPADYLLVEDSVEEAQPDEADQPVDADARNDLEINGNRTCDEGCLQATEEMAQDFVNTTMEELEGIAAAGVAVAETAAKNAESANAKFVSTPTASPAPKDMFMSPTPPVDLEESSYVTPGSAKEEVVDTPIGLEVVNSNRTDDDERCSEEYHFIEGSHRGTVTKVVEDWMRVSATEASY